MKVCALEELCAESEVPGCELIKILVGQINDKIDEVALPEKKVGVLVLKSDGKRPTYKYRLCIGYDLNSALTTAWDSLYDFINTLGTVETVLNTFL